MANHGWTPERRAAQALKIRSWRPWECSTGPKTAQGKRRAAHNAHRGDKREESRALMRKVRAILAEQRDTLPTYRY